MKLYVLLMAGAVVGLLLAELRASRLGIWIFKPLASTVFLLAALHQSALSTGYGRAVFVALVLSWWGDVLLIPKSKGSFLLGLGSFLLGHLAFGVAFFLRGVAPLGVLAGAVATVLVASRVWPWLVPHVSAGMRKPVLAYITVISTMVSLAVGCFASVGPWTVLLGALAFYVSDLAVARNRFVAPGFDNKLWGLPLYYGAQLVFVSTLGG